MKCRFVVLLLTNCSNTLLINITCLELNSPILFLMCEKWDSWAIFYFVLPLAGFNTQDCYTSEPIRQNLDEPHQATFSMKKQLHYSTCYLITWVKLKTDIMVVFKSCPDAICTCMFVLFFVIIIFFFAAILICFWNYMMNFPPFITMSNKSNTTGVNGGPGAAYPLR